MSYQYSVQQFMAIKIWFFFTFTVSLFLSSSTFFCTHLTKQISKCFYFSYKFTLKKKRKDETLNKLHPFPSRNWNFLHSLNITFFHLRVRVWYVFASIVMFNIQHQWQVKCNTRRCHAFNTFSLVYVNCGNSFIKATCSEKHRQKSLKNCRLFLISSVIPRILYHTT